MLQYKDYLNRVIEYCSAENEDAFNEVAALFPNIKEIDWDNYYPDDNYLITYILDFLIDSVDSSACVDEYFECDKSVTLDYVYSLKELEDLENILNNNGWTIDNYEDLKAEIEEEERQSKELEAKEKLIQEIKNKVTLDQLQEFYDSLT